MMSKTQPYFAPVNTSVRQQKENETMEQEQGSSERLSNLHTRMHQEAEKIRKWRIQTELEIKQKDKKILEASATVESLRKSILELQLQNEHLSLKLQEEIGNREEIIQKIDATREMCNILKDFAAKVEEKLQTCKTERTELKYLEKDHMQQFEELSEKFEQLQISTQETCNKLRNKLNEEADMKCQVQGEYDRKLEKNEMELKCLMDQCCKKDDIIQAIGIKLKENSDCISSLETELGEFQKKLCMAESVATKNTSQLESTAQELQTAKTLNQKLETSLNETSKSLQEMIASKDKMANNFDETERLYVEKIKTLQNELEDVHEDLAKQKDKIEEFQAQLTKTQNAVEDLKCTKDMLILERTEAYSKVQELEENKVQLNAELTTMKQQLSSATDDNKEQTEEFTQLKDSLEDIKMKLSMVEEEKKSLTSKKVELENETEQLYKDQELKQVEFDKLRGELKAALEQEKATFDRLDLLQLKLESECGEHAAISEHLFQLKNDNQSLQKEMKKQEKEISKLKKDVEKSAANAAKSKQGMNEAQQELKKFRNEVEELKEKLQNQADEAESKIQEEQENVHNLKEELEIQKAAANDLQAKNKSLKSDIGLKSKHIKELDKEIKTLKGKLTAQSKETHNSENKCSELLSELNDTKKRADKLEEDLEQMNKEVEVHRTSVKNIECEMKSLHKSTNLAKSDKEATSKKCEAQLKEMVATLDKYKRTNQNIVTQKEKEVEGLKRKLEEKAASETINDLEDIKKEMECMRIQCDDMKDEKERKEDALAESQQRVAELEKRVEEKVNQTKDLEAKIRKLEIDNAEVMDNLKHLETGRQPSTSSSTVLPSTPQSQIVSEIKTPLQKSVTIRGVSVEATPRQQCTPPNFQDVKTPQRSILKSHISLSELAAKKRRVMFASDDEDENGSSSESSSSELMEVEVGQLESRLKGAKQREPSTPLLVRPSPRMKLTPQQKSVNAASTPLKPVPRGQPVNLKQQKKLKNDKNLCEEELKKSNKLSAANRQDPSPNGDGKEKKKCMRLTPNIRRAPNKPNGKFCGVSPNSSKGKENKKKDSKLKKGEKEVMAWFDSDDVFGFGPED